MSYQKTFGVLCLTATLSLLPWASPSAQTTDIYVLDYAGVANYSIAVRELRHSIAELPLQIVYIAGPGWKAMVGTGLTDIKWASDSRAVKLTRYIAIVDLLKAVSVNPSDVGIVVLPSLGYADAGGLGLFPSADIYLHSADFSDAVRGDVREKDMRALVRAAEEGRLRLWRDTTVEIASGLQLHEAPPGSVGRTLVTVKAKKGTVLLGGQVLHSDIWYKRILPDAEPRVSRAIERVKKDKQIEERLVIPGHDLDLKRFPMLSKGIYRVE